MLRISENRAVDFPQVNDRALYNHSVGIMEGILKSLVQSVAVIGLGDADAGAAIDGLDDYRIRKGCFDTFQPCFRLDAKRIGIHSQAIQDRNAAVL